MIWLIFGGFILTIGDIFFTFWTKHPTTWMYIVGLGIYILGMVFLIESFKTTNIAVASAIFVVSNILTLSIVSWVFFKEPLSTLQMIGIFVAIIAIVILEI